MMKQSGLVAPFIIALTVSFAYAKPINTKYTYYLIAGDSAASLQSSMILQGPQVGGGKAYASVRMDPTVIVKTASSRESCHIEEFKMNMKFTIVLPQLKESAKLDPSLRSSFQNFYEFAKKHEEHHRSIWLDCAAETEALAQTIEAKTCPQAEAQSLQTVSEMAKRCDARHAAFDAAEHQKLAEQPFIKQASERRKFQATVATPAAPTPAN